MAWYNEAVFYHIYPIGMTGAPRQNDYGKPVRRLNSLLCWLPHIKEIGCNAIYIGPLFESVGHGYETTDYKKLDSRLGTNDDLKNFVSECHKEGIRVILDGVFNHTGRDFFAFQDIKQNRENSTYKDWYCNVNFWGNNSYNDGFSYENWGGYDLLVKLNQRNVAVKDYICDVIRYWISEFDIDGIRLDAADVMDFDYMKAFRQVANEAKADFWLMGEVIHGDYSRWVNDSTLHSVTNYTLHKALYSAFNEHNFFEVAHTIKYVNNMVGDCSKLYSFVDNHDVERIYTKLNNKAHFAPVHIMLYTLPGIPSIYYGSEFGIEGRKNKDSDHILRPALNLDDYKDAVKNNPCTALIAALGKLRRNVPALSKGDYKELELQTTHFAYEKTFEGKSAIIAVNNSDSDVTLSLPCGNFTRYIGALSGDSVCVNGGRIQVKVPANYGEVWISDASLSEILTPVKTVKIEKAPQPMPIKKEKPSQTVSASPKAETPQAEPLKAEPLKAEPLKAETPQAEPLKAETPKAEVLKSAAPKPEKVQESPLSKKAALDLNKPYEEMSIEELQEAILEKMRKNGPVTDYMLGTVRDNTHRGSLITWVRSFN